MSTSRSSRFALLLAGGLLSFVLFGTACSDDSGDAAADSNTTTTGLTVAEEDQEWCQAVRRGLNALPSELSESLQAEADVAPEEFADDYATLIAFVEYRDENPTDILGIDERTKAAITPIARVYKAVYERCGITVPLFE